VRPLSDLTQLVLPAITILGFLAVVGTGNLFMILPMGGAMMVSIGYTLYAAIRAGKQPR
jgi:hypothetical protein